jgi:hypothetical protein
MLINNKKGILPAAAVGILILFAGVIATIAFFASGTLRYTLIGIAILVGFVWVLGQAITSEVTRPKVIILSVMLLVGVGFIFGAGVLNQDFDGNRYVEIPVFGYIECKQIGQANVPEFEISENGQWVTDGMPENTNAWSLKVVTPQEFTLTNRFVEYYVCNDKSQRNSDACPIHDTRQVERNGDVLNIGTVSSTQHVWVQFQSLREPFTRGVEGARITGTHNPFSLFRVDSIRGNGELTDIVGCELPTFGTEWSNRIISYNGRDIITTAKGDSTLSPGEGFNYITANTIAVSEGNTQSGGWCIVENGNANVYEIETIQTGSGNVNRVNFDRLLTVDQCCEGFTTPNGFTCENGDLIQIEEAECTQRSDCGILERFPIEGETQTGRYDCVSNSCQIVDIQDVECVENSQCLTTERCSTETYQCVLAGISDDEGEDRDEGADKKDELECNTFQETAIVTEEVGKGPLGIGGLFGITKENEVERCVTKDYILYTGIGIFILILVTLIILLLKSTPKKGSKKKK